jgi:hypothetical protein
VHPAARPLARLDAGGVEQSVVDAQVVQLANRVGLQVDAHPQRRQFGHRLEHDAGHTELMQGERRGHATDAAGDQYRVGFAATVLCCLRHGGGLLAKVAGRSALAW